MSDTVKLRHVREAAPGAARGVDGAMWESAMWPRAIPTRVRGRGRGQSRGPEVSSQPRARRPADAVYCVRSSHSCRFVSRHDLAVTIVRVKFLNRSIAHACSPTISLISTSPRWPVRIEGLRAPMIMNARTKIVNDGSS
ncbi:hypothetical protein EVAR_88488_1 [Eumeta japonica]|uniref:Uncharacterized protein n=1 Tax=Eumeta variegata TaxID=151549 RepID=A0A4C1XSA9_EUMVA|nr:hypothetical protein EVAR_88488_1 [Eumeta japonica]